MSPTSTARAWGWVAHLREGGTTPWLAWSTDGPAAGAVDGAVDEAVDGPLPGAQQLELLRRLNLAGPPPATGLADRVLAADATGRGRPDLELVGVAERLPYGFEPVDPATLSDDELLRVAVDLVAQALTQAPYVPHHDTPEDGEQRQVPGYLAHRVRPILALLVEDPDARLGDLPADDRPPLEQAIAFLRGAS